MNADVIRFVTDKYADIERLVRLWNDFVDDLKEKLRQRAAEAGAVDPWVGDENWKRDGIRALRVRAANWRKESNVTLMLHSMAEVRLYVALDPEKLEAKEKQADKHFKVDDDVHVDTEGETLRTYTFRQRANPTAALPDIQKGTTSSPNGTAQIADSAADPSRVSQPPTRNRWRHYERWRTPLGGSSRLLTRPVRTIPGLVRA